MSLFDSLDPEKQQDLIRNNLKVGDVFLKEFEEADHKKLFIIAGLSRKKVFLCSVFINSRIHPSIANKPTRYKLQIPLLKNRNLFLKHDSFADCSYPIHIESLKIVKGIVEKTCKIIGTGHNDDVKFIRDALVGSGLLTDEQIELYFRD